MLYCFLSFFCFSLLETGFGLTNFADTKCGQRSVKIIPKASRISRIVGGADAVRGEFPWIVSLQYTTRPPQSSHFCGGFLINNRYVITAAHCVRTVSTDGMHVIVGEHVIGVQEIPLNAFAVAVDHIIKHPEYDENVKARNDIAIIRLQDAIEWNPYVQPACLPNEGDIVSVGEKTFVAGWGYTRSENPEISRTLMTVDIPVVSNTKCEDDYDKWTATDGEICAGTPYEGRGACEGDSGSPLMRWEKANESLGVIGIHSGGYGCGTDMRSGIYTHLASYVNWIKYNVK